MRRLRWLGLLIGPLLLLAPPHGDASAARRQRIEWTAVEVRAQSACSGPLDESARRPARPKPTPQREAAAERAPGPRAGSGCSSDRGARVARSLKTMLQEASRKADWGKGPSLQLTASITELAWEQRDDVLRLDVAVVGRIVGAKGVRSRIRVGGRLAERSKLEREALQIVATGLVTRLADLARRPAAR